MDKNFLLRADDVLKRLKTKILLDEEIRTMLYYDEVTTDTVTPPVEIVADHVFIQPIIDTDVVEPFNKKNYITITFPEIGLNNNFVEYVVRIIVMCDRTTWLFNDQARPLLLAQKIINLLDGFKTKFSNELIFDSIVETVTNKKVCGYSILFNVQDGISE